MGLYEMKSNPDGSIVFTPVTDPTTPASEKGGAVTASMRLSVPWLSQMGALATFAPGDCGTACVAMLCHFLGRPATVDEVSKATLKPSGFSFLHFNELIAVAARLGLVLSYQHGLSIVEMTAAIDAHRPVIALVDYQHLPVMIRFDANYNAGHYVLMVGYDAGHVIYHDPYWPTETGGAFRSMTRDEFYMAYSAVAPGNTAARHALVLASQ